MNINRFARRGFTMLEIIMVITIAGTLMMITLPKIESALRSAAADRSSRVVANDMEVAISAAARARKPLRVAYTSSSMTYTVTDRAAGTVYVNRSLGTGTAYNLSTATFSPASFDVLPTGLLSQAVTITLKSSTRTQTITVSRAGQIRVVKS